MSEFIESPILTLGARAGVVFHGRLMLPSTAQRIKKYEPDLRRFAEQGKSVTEVARGLGYSVHTVRTWAELLGIPIRPKKPTSKPHDTSGWYQVVMAGIKDGLTQEEIGAKLGVHSMQICRFCKRNNISWRRAKHFTQ